MSDAIMTIKQDGSASIRHISDGSPFKRGEFPIDLNNSGSESYLFTTSQTWTVTKSGFYLLALWGAGGGGGGGGSLTQGGAGTQHSGGGGGSGLLIVEIAYIDEGEYSLIVGKGGTGGKAAPSISITQTITFDGIAATDGEATSIPELEISAPGGSKGGCLSGQSPTQLKNKGLGGGYLDGGGGAGTTVSGKPVGYGSSGGEGGSSSNGYHGYSGGGGGSVAGGKGGDGGEGNTSNAYAPGNPGQNGKNGGGGGGGGSVMSVLTVKHPYDVFGGDGGDGGDGAILVMRLM